MACVKGRLAAVDEAIGAALVPGSGASDPICVLPGYSVAVARHFQGRLRAFSYGLRLHAFVQPLYVPREYVTHNYSVGLHPRGFGDAKLWSPTDPNLASEVTACIHEQALPFLAAIETPAELMAVAYGRLKAGS